MLEGKEFSGKIGKDGEFGEYGVDVKPDGNIESNVKANVVKALFGFVAIKGSCDFTVNLDLVGVLQAVTKDTKSSMLQSAVGGIAKLLRG